MDRRKMASLVRLVKQDDGERVRYFEHDHLRHHYPNRNEKKLLKK